MPEMQPIQVAGSHWQVTAECKAALFDNNGLRLPEWLARGLARIVKCGPHRTVYHVCLPEFELYLKHYRVADWRARLRRWIRPSKARTEFERTLAVAASHIPTAAPVAVGEERAGQRAGECYFVTLGLSNTENLSTFIELSFHGLPKGIKSRVRIRLATALGKLVARMHDSGIVHSDLHAGNLLVRRTDDNVEMFLIDLHDVQIVGPLNWRQSQANLIILNRWFVLCANRSDRLRFWRSYIASRAALRLEFDPDHSRRCAQEVEAKTWLSNYRFWFNRDRRCLLSNRHFHLVRSTHVKGHAARSLDAESLELLSANPDAPFDESPTSLLKNSRSSTVAAIDVIVDGKKTQAVWKRFRLKRTAYPWLGLFRQPPALRSWVYGNGVRDRGLPTPRPLLVLHRHNKGLPCEGYLLTERIPDAVDLHSVASNFVHFHAAERRTRLAGIIDRVARLVRELHGRRLSHRDLKAANLLMSPQPFPLSVIRDEMRGERTHSATTTPEVWLIDLVGVRAHRQLSCARRVQDIARLNASFCSDDCVSRTDKLRFLRTYLQWGLLGRTGWKRWWHEIDKATQRKITKNRRNGRPLA